MRLTSEEELCMSIENTQETYSLNPPPQETNDEMMDSLIPAASVFVSRRAAGDDSSTGRLTSSVFLCHSEGAEALRETRRSMAIIWEEPAQTDPPDFHTKSHACMQHCRTSPCETAWYRDVSEIILVFVVL